MYLSCKQSGILQTEDTHIWAFLRTVLYSFRTSSGSLTIFAHEQVSPIYSSHCTFRNTSDFSSTFWTNFIVINTCTRYLFLYLTQFVLFLPKQVDINTARSASYIELHLEIDCKGSIKNKTLRSKIDDFNFANENISFIGCNIPAAHIY